jgi:type I restriction enzyme R subunit
MAKMSNLFESDVEQAALAWLETLGWTGKHGSETAPGTQAGERADFGQAVLALRLRDALARP